MTGARRALGGVLAMCLAWVVLAGCTPISVRVKGTEHHTGWWVGMPF